MADKLRASAVWRQLPFFIWLVALWMLLWGQFTVLALITGIAVAVFVTAQFRLPPVELSGRVNVWWTLAFFAEFLVSVVQGSLVVAWQVIDPRRQPGAAIIAVPLVTDDDLIMTHVGVTCSLIPGSLVIDLDRDRRILYMHVLGARSDAQIEKHKRQVLHWEARLVRAVGSRSQLQAIRVAGAEQADRKGAA